VLWNLQFRAKKSGLLRKGSTKYLKASAAASQESKKSFSQKAAWLISEIDLVGSLLLVAGLFLILLPLILATSWGGWNSSKPYSLDPPTRPPNETNHVDYYHRQSDRVPGLGRCYLAAIWILGVEDCR